jgi:DNA-binding MarR family transcriptional regulator
MKLSPKQFEIINFMINNINCEYFFTILDQFHDKIEQKMHAKLKGSFGEMTILQIKACMIIAKYDQIRMSDFAKIMLLKTSGATQLIDKMIESNFVKREIDPTDRRIVLISLEKEMKKQISRMKKIESEILKESFNNLNPAEFQMLTKLIQKLI